MRPAAHASSAASSPTCTQNGVRVRVIGERERAAPTSLALIDEAEALTRDKRGLNLIVAFNYGAPRRDRPRRARELAETVAEGRLDPTAIDAEMIAGHLDTRRACPTPTSSSAPAASSACRNFLLWQAAYTEFVFLDVSGRTSRASCSRPLSPNISGERRFGGTSARSTA